MAGRKTSETALERHTAPSDEISPTRASAEAVADIQSAIIVSRKFPRNEETAYQKLMHACERTNFAEDAMYAFPRFSAEEGKKVTITGPSVNLAREAARVWGNIRWGLVIVADSDETRTIEGWGYDLEANTRVSQEDTFNKTVYTRKDGWRPANERDLRELTARRGAFLVRNSLLQLVPKDFISDAMDQVEKTLASKARQDPDAQKKAVISAFDRIGVPADQLESYLGHALATLSPEEIAKLRSVYKSIEDGNSTWAEYLTPRPGEAKVNGQEKPKGPAPVSSTNERPLAPAPAVAAAQATAGAATPMIDNQEKGLVHQMARKKGWERNKSSPDDALHRLLDRDFSIQSVEQILKSCFRRFSTRLHRDRKRRGLSLSHRRQCHLQTSRGLLPGLRARSFGNGGS